MSTFQHFLRKLPIRKELLWKSNCTSICKRLLSYVSKEYSAQHDPASLFISNDIQNLLKTLTRIDLHKVYRKRKLEQKRLELPTYKFMNDEQLQAAMLEAQKRTNEMLQMPPVVAVRDPVQRILAEEPALQGLDTSKLIITDITFGKKSAERLVVIREVDGTLKEASWDVRDRMNQIYFPIAGRKLRTPLMFEDHYLESLLKRKEYEFILDRCCVQFEPNNVEYQKVTSITYQHIDANGDFDVLRSTRHFGPLVFFLSWFKSVDNLLVELIETAHIEEASSLLQLYGKMHKIESLVGDNVEIVQKYIAEFSNKKGQLELALQAYKELEQERKELSRGIKVAHGAV